MKRPLLLFLFSVIGLLNSLAYTGYVGENFYLSAPTAPGILVTATWFSDDINFVSVSGDTNGATVTILQYFSGTLQIDCAYTYTYYSGNRIHHSYVEHAYYKINCLKSTATIDKKELKLNVGQTATLKYNNSSGYSLPNGVWTTDNMYIATVNDREWDFAKEVRVDALEPGECTITFDGHCGSDPVTCKVTVVKVDPTSMKLSPNPLVLSVGKKSSFKPIYTPSDATALLKWNSSNESIATVSSTGMVTGKSEGTAIITAKTDKGISAQAKVEVVGSPTSISLPTTTSVYVGYYHTITPTLSPPKSISTFSWTSSDKTIATVSGGKIYGKKEGTCIITATSDNGLTASTTLTVKPVKKGFDKPTANYRIKTITNLVKKIK